jgi:hypothetical protein
MATRIRYKETNGVLISNPMIMGADLITATITDTTYAITTQTGLLIAHGDVSNLAKAKKLVKNKIKGFGVPFDDEVRRRKPLTLEQKSDKLSQ